MRVGRWRNLGLGLLSAACLGFTLYVGHGLLFRPDFVETPIGGPFVLEDQNGRTVTDADLRGGYLLIYFGYTFCPDICPTELVEMTNALDILEAEAEARAARVTPVFITVDPARDTVAALAAYLPHFHPRFIGLTGSEAAIAEAAEGYRVYYRVEPGAANGEDYLLDHSSYVYLMDGEGRYVTHFTAQQGAAQMAARLAELVEP